MHRVSVLFDLQNSRMSRIGPYESYGINCPTCTRPPCASHPEISPWLQFAGQPAQRQQVTQNKAGCKASWGRKSQKRLIACITCLELAFSIAVVATWPPRLPFPSRGIWLRRPLASLLPPEVLPGTETDSLPRCSAAVSALVSSKEHFRIVQINRNVGCSLCTIHKLPSCWLACAMSQINSQSKKVMP